MLEINNLNGDHKILMTRAEWLEEASKTYMPLIYWPAKLHKCEYCNSEFDATYINCPNCGAPIRSKFDIKAEWHYEYHGIPVEFID